MEKTPNIIYLDLTRNGSASALCGSLVHLAGVEQELNRAMMRLGIPLFVRADPHALKGRRAHTLILENELGQILGHKARVMPSKLSKVGPRAPQWNKNIDLLPVTETDSSNGAQSQKQLKQTSVPPAGKTSLWQKKSLTYIDVKNVLQKSHLDAMIQAMCLRVVRNTFDVLSDNESEKRISSETLQALIVYALSVSLALEELSPVGIGCSELPFNGRHNQELKDDILIDLALELAINLPTFEDHDLCSADIFSLSILQTFVTEWGYRPRGKIKKIRRGTDELNACVGVAYLIAPPAIVSQQSKGFRIQRALNWEILLQPQSSVTALRQGLKNFGATHFYVLPVYQADGEPLSLVKTTLPHERAREALEWCFSEGLAQKINAYEVQEESLAINEVQLPWGRGASQETVTVVENWWLDRVIRIVPDETDVNRIAMETGFTTEAVRTDIVRAWQRWSNESLDAVE